MLDTILQYLDRILPHEAATWLIGLILLIVLVWLYSKSSASSTKIEAEADKTKAEADLLIQQGYQKAIADFKAQVESLKAELATMKTKVQQQDQLIGELQRELAVLEAERNLWRNLALGKTQSTSGEVC